jgi:hypothetical protein
MSEIKNELKRNEWNDIGRKPNNLNRKSWTKEEINILQQYYPMYGARGLILDLLPDRRPTQILTKANELRLKYDASILFIGKIFGAWTVVEQASRPDKKNRYWKCKCKCGVIKIVPTCFLNDGSSRSCGCEWLELYPIIVKEKAAKRWGTFGKNSYEYFIRVKRAAKNKIWNLI